MSVTTLHLKGHFKTKEMLYTFDSGWLCDGQLFISHMDDIDLAAASASESHYCVENCVLYDFWEIQNCVVI